MRHHSLAPRRIILSAAGLAAMQALTIASAPAARAEEPPARYQIEKTKYGFVRMDSVTGAMTFCREDDDGLSCGPAASETSAVEDRLQSLTQSVSDLETRIKAAEAALAQSDARLKAAEAQAEKPRGVTGSLPSDAEIDEAFSFMERMMRRFMDLGRSLEDEQGLPQKT